MRIGSVLDMQIGSESFPPRASQSLRGETPISRASPQRKQGTSTVESVREVVCGFPLLALRAGRKIVPARCASKGLDFHGKDTA